jgi:hypothetical protein
VPISFAVKRYVATKSFFFSSKFFLSSFNSTSPSTCKHTFTLRDLLNRTDKKKPTACPMTEHLYPHRRSERTETCTLGIYTNYLTHNSAGVEKGRKNSQFLIPAVEGKNGVGMYGSVERIGQRRNAV